MENSGRTRRHWRLLKNDTFQDEAAKLIFDNGGGRVSGRGGCGKSKIVEKLTNLYKEAGYRCDVVGFTHVQAANIEGKTVLHDLWHNIKCKNRVLIIDEASQLPLYLWSIISTFAYVGCKIVVLALRRH